MKSSYGRAVKKPVRYDGDSDMLVKCTNQNCIEENNINYFRICTWKNHSINLKSQINNKVDNSVFDDMINESKKKN